MTQAGEQNEAAPAKAGRAGHPALSLLLWTGLAVFGYLLIIRNDSRGLIVLIIELTAGFVAYGLSFESTLTRVAQLLRTQAVCLALPSALALISVATIYLSGR